MRQSCLVSALPAPYSLSISAPYSLLPYLNLRIFIAISSQVYASSILSVHSFTGSPLSTCCSIMRGTSCSFK